MAYGRKDYFWGVAPEKSVFGELQNSWIHTGANAIGAGASVTILTYNVPVGYNLEITGIDLSCTGADSHHVQIKVDGVAKLITYFDTQKQITFGDAGTLTVKGGEQLTVLVQNNDAQTLSFCANGYGFLQQVVT